MATIKVVAGDLPQCDWTFTGSFGAAVMSEVTVFKKPTKIDFRKDVERIELMDEERVKKLSGTAGWGLAGLALLGPLGAVGGMLLGGNKKQVAFAAYLKDGRKFMGVTDGKSWQKIQAAAF